jgi:phage gp16-like protein
MTPNHHPYLTDTDLRTAEDVLEWLRHTQRHGCEGHDPRDSEGVDLTCAIQALRSKVDRERRQACRRGALQNWRFFSDMARWCRDRGLIPREASERATLKRLATALSFRAAARGK